MDLKQLNTFLAVSRLRSFTQAADALGYVQSSVTAQIQMLEKELGSKLFERFGRTIALTSEGQRLLPYAEQILQLSQEAKNALSSSKEPSGSLTIGIVAHLCINRIPELLKAYRTRCPKVDILLTFGSCSDFRRALRNNTMDLAFFLERKIQDPDLVTILSYQEPIAALAVKEHPLASKKSIGPQDLSEEALIVTKAGCGCRDALDLSKVRPRSIMETDNIDAMKQLAMNGLGIAFLPKAAAEEELDKGQLVDLNWAGPDFNVLAQVVHRKNKCITPAMTALFKLMREMGF